jgi:adenosine kinase
MKSSLHFDKKQNAYINIKRVIVYGSLAYDRVMDFPGKFRDNFLPDKLHLINVSFAVPKLTENFGGTAGNIAYNLSLLRARPIILAEAGNDFIKYSKWLVQLKIETKHIYSVKDLPTASAYIITDKEDNQITGFYSGAIQKHYPSFSDDIFKNALVIISPGNCRDMSTLVKICFKKQTPFIYDPGQQIPHLTKNELAYGVKNSLVFIGNDYEISLVAHILKISEQTLIQRANILIKTLGAKGSEIWHKGKCIKIPAFKPRQVIDPTGAGDAYRAGLAMGLLRHWPITKIGRFVSLVASYAVEQYGTQKHKFTQTELEQRYSKRFKENLF